MSSIYIDVNIYAINDTQSINSQRSCHTAAVAESSKKLQNLVMPLNNSLLLKQLTQPYSK